MISPESRGLEWWKVIHLIAILFSEDLIKITAIFASGMVENGCRSRRDGLEFGGEGHMYVAINSITQIYMIKIRLIPDVIWYVF